MRYFEPKIGEYLDATNVRTQGGVIDGRSYASLAGASGTLAEGFPE